MDPKKTQIQVREELLLAKQSRLEGNEGRARVCARRAAGAAVKLYLDHEGMLNGSENALQALEILQGQSGLPPRVETAVDRLIQRVDQNYSLPVEIDLIKEAKIILEYIDQINPDISAGSWV
jgi:hypothetical protein